MRMTEFRTTAQWKQKKMSSSYLTKYSGMQMYTNILMTLPQRRESCPAMAHAMEGIKESSPSTGNCDQISLTFGKRWSLP